MKHLSVVRSYTQTATIGFIDMPSGKRLQTLERPWLNNRPNESCIPQGTYLVGRDNSGRWQYYSVTNVPNRTFIEIHPANHVGELAGCLSLGMERANNNESLVWSQTAIDLFVGEMGDDDFLITFRSFSPDFDSLREG